MATLTQLTLDADGTIDAVIRHDAGTGSPFNTHLNDAPDGLSSDYVENDDSETSGTAWFRLSEVDGDFSSMDTLNIDVDVQALGFSNDTCTLTARIFDADNDTANPLSGESDNLGTDADGTRVQRNVSFAGLTGTKAQWNAAHIRYTWTYTKTAGPDNANLRIYGCDIDGTYTAVVPKASGPFTVLGPGAYPRPPYGSFAGKVAAAGDGKTVTASLEAALRKQQEIAPSLNAGLQKTFTRTLGTDAAVALLESRTASLEAVVHKPMTAQTGLAAALRKGQVATALADAAVQIERERQAGLAAALALARIGVANLDAVLRRVETRSTGLDAALDAAQSAAVALDAGLARETTVAAALQAAVRATVSTATGLDASISELGLRTTAAGLSAALRATATAGAALDAALEFARETSAAADAALAGTALLGAGLDANLDINLDPAFAPAGTRTFGHGADRDQAITAGGRTFVVPAGNRKH